VKLGCQKVNEVVFCALLLTDIPCCAVNDCTGEAGSVNLEVKNSCKILNLLTLSKDKFGQVRHRREDDIRINLLETRCKDLVWIHMAYVRVLCHDLVKTVMNCRVPLSVSNFMTRLGPVVPCVTLFCGRAEGRHCSFVLFD